MAADDHSEENRNDRRPKLSELWESSEESPGAVKATSWWDRQRIRAERMWSGVEAQRSRSASIDSAFEAVERDTQSGGGVLAAAVAFRLFMFLVPYAFVVVTGLGLASTTAGKSPQDAVRSAGIGGLLAKAVASTGSMSLTSRILALVVGVIALTFTSRSLVRVLSTVHQLIWRVRLSAKPTFQSVLILLGFATLLFGVADLVGWLGSKSPGLKVLAVVTSVVITTAAWLLASWWLPHSDCQWWALIPGAVIVGVGVGLLHLLTITYIAHEVARKSTTYGAIGIAVALLLWTYFLGRLLTASIAANASLWNRRKTGTQ